MPEAFYVATAEGYEPTELTRGPWDPNSQHAGPPAALIGRALEDLPATPSGGASASDDRGGAGNRRGGPGEDQNVEWQVGRVTYEILRAVPITQLTLTAKIERPGRRVQMVSASLADERGEVVRARGWRVAKGDVSLPPGVGGAAAEPMADPEEAPEAPFFDTGFDVGYHTAMEYRFVVGRFLDPGPAKVWMRMRAPLIAGEEPSPLQRVLIAADSGNGVSATLDWSRYLFINVDLSVHLHRMPRGEWVMLDALTIPEPTGLGLAESALRDREGPIGHALQTLLVRER